MAFYTLGCKVNQNETEALAGIFKEHKYSVVEFDEVAQVYVINTCTVTHLGDRKSRQMIRRAIKLNPQAKIVVTGCYAQTSPGEVSQIPGVDLIIGTKDRARIIELVKEIDKSRGPLNKVAEFNEKNDFEELPIDRLVKRTRAYLKVQEGCEQFCSYCIIPYARGPIRSRSLESCVNETKRLVEAGFKEVILTGIHLGAYGHEVEGHPQLAELCEALLAISGLKRLRLSSIEPTEITAELLDLMKENKHFCRHLHIPLQSGQDEILKAMNRPYTTEDYHKIITNIRRKIPGIGITTDIIIGFPGETHEQFDQICDFVKEVSFSDMHVFKYSPRKGTPAADFPNQVPPVEKEKRSKFMMEISERNSEAFAKTFIGQQVECLVETPWADKQDWFEGHTDNYLRVVFQGQDIEKGQLVMVKIEKYEENRLVGKSVTR